MASFSTIIGAVGLGLQAFGTITTMQGNAKAAEASQRAEKLRERQMNLESTRQRRSTIRQALRTRSMALFAASDQGAGAGSGIAGGLGQISGDAARGVQGVNQGQQIGAGIFAANRDVTAGQSMASFGGGISSLGGALFGSADTLGRLGTYYTQR